MSPPDSMRDAVDRPHAADRPLDNRFAVPLATHVVPRTRLHARLTAGLDAACVVIAAPAGWGKTVLASSWLADDGAGRAVAWISLGATEDELRGFWTAVATALGPAVGERAATDLRKAVSTDDLEQVPGKVVAALAAAETPVVLVLDNLHELTDLTVHESLLRLVQRPPPGLRFVVTTRRDPPWPLHRLRLAGLLTEIRAADLAFRSDEAATLFAQLGIDLDTAVLDRLLERTDGWAAGVRLAALAVQGTDDPAGFVNAFSGEDHAVAAYLLTEVIDRQPPELVDFLVRVSVLDIVSASLADAMTGDTTGAATLARLAASNLFVQAVGPGGRWYRLHRLIADLLRSRISEPRRRRDLYRRAAEWWRRQGMPLEAIRYALRGGLWPMAAELLGVNVLALILRGNPREVELLLSAVPREVLLAHPELAAALAAARTLQGSRSELGELLVAARAGLVGLSRTRSERLTVVLDLIECGDARFHGDMAALTAACRRVPVDAGALAPLGLAGWDMVPLLVTSNAGTGEFWTGDAANAEKHLLTAIDIDRTAGMLRPHLNAMAHLTLLRCERGDLRGARADALAVVADAADAGWALSAQAVPAYLTLAWVALDRDEPGEAGTWLARVDQVETITPEPHIQLTAAALTALLRADAGDVEGALVGLRTTTTRLASTAPTVLADRLLAVEADLVRETGDLQRAAEVLTGIQAPERSSAAQVLARLHASAGDVATAERTLATFPASAGTLRERVEGAVLSALLTANYDRATALHLLEDALLAAAPVEMRRPFLVKATKLRALLTDRIEAGSAVAAFAVDLQRRMSGQRSQPPVAPAAALTDREQLVLRYLASTLSNSEIAAELYLSVNTVKSHQRMIYRKLVAEGRRDAVRRAKELRIL